jgi:hypothetical protein
VDVVALSSIEKPSERMVSSVDTRKANEAFDRRVTEYWMMVREAILCENIKGLNLLKEGSVSPLVNQLCTRTYSIKGKKFSLETKDDYKERTLQGSPDHADALCYTVEMARRHGLVLKSPEDEKREEDGQAVSWASLSQPRELEYRSDDWGEDEETARAA